MRFSIVYFSAAGHTLKVIRHIAEQMGGIDRAVDLSDPFLKETSFTKDDQVIVACPVYGGRIPSLVAERLQKITFDGTRAVSIVTYGNRAYEDALLELNDTLLARGSIPVASAAVVAQHTMVPSVASDRPTPIDFQNLSVFARFALQKFDDVHAVPVEVPGNRPYRQWSKMPVTPVVSNECVRCGLCVRQCPTMAIWITDPKKTDPSKCILCMRCVALCPQGARSLPESARQAIEKKLAPVAKLTRENEFFF
ncbi:MAG TPA: 4Fe-4S binding protein [Candidatus Aphodousia faecavium]|nr:4Fe-4S binding protein [Candidatus Aphodousia faecavium]